MWAIITGGFMFTMAIIFSLGEASSKREDVAHNHREELLARSNDSGAEAIRVEPSPEPIEQNSKNNESKTPHPSEQL